MKTALAVVAAHGQIKADASIISELISVVDNAESVASANVVEYVPKPGKGDVVYGSKQRYFKYSQNGNSLFQAAVFHFDKAVFENMTGTKMSEFNDLPLLAEREIAQPMNVGQQFSVQVQRYRENRKRALQPRGMMFYSFNFLRAGVEGSRRLCQLNTQVGISNGTESNYTRHVRVVLLDFLFEDPMVQIVWPDHSERQQMEGLVYVIPDGVCFVHGMKQHTFRPKVSNPMRKNQPSGLRQKRKSYLAAIAMQFVIRR